jgi:hypothetical protein
MKKLVLLAGAAVLLLALGVVGYVLVHDARERARCERFHGERFADIKPGMTRVEVEELLGAPPGNYARKGYMVYAYGHIIPNGVKREEWIDDKHMYEVHYTHDDKVAGTHVRANMINSK